MEEIKIQVNRFVLRDEASGKTRTVRSVLTLEELAALIRENEKEEARWKVEDALAGLYGSEEE